MSWKPAEIDSQAPIHWADREEYKAYFNSLPTDERWTHPRYPLQPMICHWDGRYWLALEDES